MKQDIFCPAAPSATKHTAPGIRRAASAETALFRHHPSARHGDGPMRRSRSPEGGLAFTMRVQRGRSFSEDEAEDEDAADEEAGTEGKRASFTGALTHAWSTEEKRTSFTVTGSAPSHRGRPGPFKVERTSRAAMKPMLYKHDDVLVSCFGKRSREVPPRQAKISSAMLDEAMDASPGLSEPREEEAFGGLDITRSASGSSGCSMIDLCSTIW
ncbi:hypothetical protein T484DRAFT_1952270 [Baffinella frigidus]|nr:hypothetical protein T484DRAFT_1952270 [Cryptophyta sp. CCMP2293]